MLKLPHLQAEHCGCIPLSIEQTGISEDLGLIDSNKLQVCNCATGANKKQLLIGKQFTTAWFDHKKKSFSVA